jgi:hypothetical protein
MGLFVYESIKRELKIKPMYECQCDERLQMKRFTRLSYTGLVEELEHLKIKTRLGGDFWECDGWVCLLVISSHVGLGTRARTGPLLVFGGGAGACVVSRVPSPTICLYL